MNYQEENILIGEDVSLSLGIESPDLKAPKSGLWFVNHK
jgi:hypothetical protein